MEPSTTTKFNLSTIIQYIHIASSHVGCKLSVFDGYEWAGGIEADRKHRPSRSRPFSLGWNRSCNYTRGTCDQANRIIPTAGSAHHASTTIDSILARTDNYTRVSRSTTVSIIASRDDGFANLPVCNSFRPSHTFANGTFGAEPVSRLHASHSGDAFFLRFLKLTINDFCFVLLSRNSAKPRSASIRASDHQASGFGDSSEGAASASQIHSCKSAIRLRSRG